MHNHSYENVFHWQVYFRVNKSHFDMKGLHRDLFETETQSKLEMASHDISQLPQWL